MTLNNKNDGTGVGGGGGVYPRAASDASVALCIERKVTLIGSSRKQRIGDFVMLRGRPT